MPRRDDIKTIMVLGSGPIKIGQAAELTSLAAKQFEHYEKMVTKSSWSIQTQQQSKTTLKWQILSTSNH